MPPRLSKKDQEKAEEYGGTEVDIWREYETNDQFPSCDKGGHKERNLANAPNHNRHWRKQERRSGGLEYEGW